MRFVRDGLAMLALVIMLALFCNTATGLTASKGKKAGVLVVKVSPAVYYPSVSATSGISLIPLYLPDMPAGMVIFRWRTNYGYFRDEADILGQEVVTRGAKLYWSYNPANGDHGEPEISLTVETVKTGKILAQYKIELGRDELGRVTIGGMLTSLGDTPYNMDELERIIEVKEKHEAELLSITEVVGIGVGECAGRLCIKVYVEKLTDEVRRAIPEELEGFKVDIEESGPIEAL